VLLVFVMFILFIMLIYLCHSHFLSHDLFFCMFDVCFFLSICIIYNYTIKVVIGNTIFMCFSLFMVWGWKWGLKCNGCFNKGFLSF
jgi:hypothetical protein